MRSMISIMRRVSVRVHEGAIGLSVLSSFESYMVACGLCIATRLLVSVSCECEWFCAVYYSAKLKRDLFRRARTYNCLGA